MLRRINELFWKPHECVIPLKHSKPNYFEFFFYGVKKIKKCREYILFTQLVFISVSANKNAALLKRGIFSIII